VAVGPDGGTLYTTNYFFNTLSILDVSTLEAAINRGEHNGKAEITRSISVAEEPYGIALSRTANGCMWPISASKHVVSVIDVEGQAVVETIEAGHGMVRALRRQTAAYTSRIIAPIPFR
jgi:DNA-binding beta-propeller fold protein YncE